MKPSLAIGRPRRMRNWLRREPLRTSTLNVRGETSA
jgi:hypothetical protein